MISDILGYKKGRTASKLILVLSAIAVSTFAMSGFIAEWMNFDLWGLQLRNIIALSLIIVGVLLKDDILNPPSIPFLNDRNITKFTYYIGLALVALAISSFSFSLLNQLMDINFMSYPWLAIRNVVAVILLFGARTIHKSG